MKTSIAITALFSFALAAPPEYYTLSTKSDKVNSLSNLFLSAKGGLVGAYPGTREAASKAFSQFFTVPYTPTNTLSLHTGAERTQLGLQGEKGLLQLVELEWPSAEKYEQKPPTMWSVFTVGPRGNVGVKDGSDIPSRTWVTWLETDGNYYVGLWDGVTPQPRALSNITLVAAKAAAK